MIVWCKLFYLERVKVSVCLWIPLFIVSFVYELIVFVKFIDLIKIDPSIYIIDID